MSTDSGPLTKSAALTYVGTLVGESTSREFRLAVRHEAAREQDIIAVDAELSEPSQPNASPQ